MVGTLIKRTPMAAIAETRHALPHGIHLNCRHSGQPGRPVLLFLHGFPEGAFAWDAMLAHFSKPENGGYFCVAPHLRGFETSSAPTDPAAYRAKFLVQDILALIDIVSPRQALAALVAHDWGGAVAWNLANQHPEHLQRLVIINSPHPGTFLRDLQSNPAQQAASAYMNFLIRPDAAALLAANDYQRLWGFFNTMANGQASWLDTAMKDRYRAHWAHGLEGGLNYYRASPLRPPRPDDHAASLISLPDAMLRIAVPAMVIWGLQDKALLPCLIEGLDDHIPDLELHTLADASHWVVHEQPAVVQAYIRGFLARA
jgi:pimeloyl-ACP methyl ester carboxylesterase